MDALTKALSLSEIGCFVFPVTLTEDGTKKPLTKNGHLDATDDVEQIAQWFQNEFPEAHVGVHAGRSGLNLLDRDIKYDDDGNETKNGFEALTDAWLVADDTFNYTSIRGKGRHDIYLAPDNVVLNGKADYRGMLGVDRRAGSSWFLWAGDTVPNSRDAFAPAPDWLNDPSVIRTGEGFEGEVDEWIDSLVAGQPNVLVRQAIERIPEDMSHSEMVERQYNAVRLGAEGNPGVIELFGAIEAAWLGRPEQNHTTSREEWPWKFEEALMSGIEKYGAYVERIENLPKFNLGALSGKVNTSSLTGSPQDSYHFSKVLNELASADLTDDERASVLWNAPTTQTLAREWGIDFVYQRVEKAHKTPEPERENPQLEQSFTREGYIRLIDEDEQRYIDKRPTFVDTYAAAAKNAGLDNPVYVRSGAWNVASMAYAFKGFIKQGSDKIMGVNLFNITTGPSGTGKSTHLEFEEVLMDTLFRADNGEKSAYATSGDTSPQGILVQLLERDRKPSILIQDEASIFFKAVQTKGWMEELTHAVTDWYGGKVRGSSKLNLKELRGKTALTSFHISMYGTPKMLFSLLNDDMFEFGFLARVTWDLAPPATAEQKERGYDTREYDDEDSELDIEAASPFVTDLVTDLVTSARMLGSKPQRIKTDAYSRERMRQAFKKMGTIIEGHAKEDILGPSVTRLGADTMRKCAAICAMYRGDTIIGKADTLHAIKAVEVWFNYLLEVVELVAQGHFQNLCNDMEHFILTQKSPTETQVNNAFRNRIQRDPRELESALRFLISSGRVNLKQEQGKVDRYVINGGK